MSAIKSDVQTTSSWLDSGAGPTLTLGATWTSGAALKPPSGVTIPSGSTITTIDYWWDNLHLNGWTDQVSVELYLTSSSASPLEIDITALNEGTVDVSSYNYPADCIIYFRMKVATGGTLFDPPYCVEDQVVVHYQY